MRLSRSQNWCLWIMVVGLCLILFFKAHTGMNVHSMTIDQPSPYIVSIAAEIYELAVREEMESVKWSILWRGRLPSEHEDVFMSWLTSPEQSFTRSEMTNRSSAHHTILEEVWVKNEQGVTHQVQKISYPHKERNITNIIYTVSGNHSDQLWESNISSIEDQLIKDLLSDYQVFTTVEGVTNPTFFQQDKHQETYNRWIEDNFEGKVVHSIEDTSFLSVTGYIPAWGKQVLFTGQEETNIQLSARYNALDEQTRVTLGYPLILKEH